MPAVAAIKSYNDKDVWWEYLCNSLIEEVKNIKSSECSDHAHSAIACCGIFGKIAPKLTNVFQYLLIRKYELNFKPYIGKDKEPNSNRTSPNSQKNGNLFEFKKRKDRLSMVHIAGRSSTWRMPDRMMLDYGTTSLLNKSASRARYPSSRCRDQACRCLTSKGSRKK